MINNRQNGRRRGRGGGGGNNNPRQGGQGRGDSANRIDSRARGNANQLYEKYKNLARDAQMSGDRINVEYYLQFADHYFRVLADQRGRMENDSQPRRQQPFDVNGDDDDDMLEGEPIRAGEQNGEYARGGDGQNERSENQRPQNERSQNDGGRRDRSQNERGRNERAEGDGNRGDRGDQNDRFQGDRQTFRRDRDAQGERRPRAGREEVGGQHRSDPPTADEPLDQRAAEVLEADAPLEAPARRRGRPRREAAVVEPGRDTGEDTALAADRLPPAISAAPANDSDGEQTDAPKPRRRLRRPAAEASAAE